MTKRKKHLLGPTTRNFYCYDDLHISLSKLNKLIFFRMSKTQNPICRNDIARRIRSTYDLTLLSTHRKSTIDQFWLFVQNWMSQYEYETCYRSIMIWCWRNAVWSRINVRCCKNPSTASTHLLLADVTHKIQLNALPTFSFFAYAAWPLDAFG